MAGIDGWGIMLPGNTRSHYHEDGLTLCGCRPARKKGDPDPADRCRVCQRSLENLPKGEKDER